MFCSNCGQKNDEGAKFCVKCGNTISSVESHASESSTAQQQLSKAPISNQTNYSTYDQVPIYRKNWCAISVWLIFMVTYVLKIGYFYALPLFVLFLIAVSGNIYYKNKIGQVRRYSTLVRSFLIIIVTGGILKASYLIISPPPLDAVKTTSDNPATIAASEPSNPPPTTITNIPMPVQPKKELTVDKVDEVCHYIYDYYYVPNKKQITAAEGTDIESQCGSAATSFAREEPIAFDLGSLLDEAKVDPDSYRQVMTNAVRDACVQNARGLTKQSYDEYKQSQCNNLKSTVTKANGN
jgi:hypothetical protein